MVIATISDAGVEDMVYVQIETRAGSGRRRENVDEESKQCNRLTARLESWLIETNEVCVERPRRPVLHALLDEGLPLLISLCLHRNHPAHFA